MLLPEAENVYWVNNESVNCLLMPAKNVFVFKFPINYDKVKLGAVKAIAKQQTLNWEMNLKCTELKCLIGACESRSQVGGDEAGIVT